MHPRHFLNHQHIRNRIQSRAAPLLRHQHPAATQQRQFLNRLKRKLLRPLPLLHMRTHLHLHKRPHRLPDQPLMITKPKIHLSVSFPFRLCVLCALSVLCVKLFSFSPDFVPPLSLSSRSPPLSHPTTDIFPEESPPPSTHPTPPASPSLPDGAPETSNSSASPTSRPSPSPHTNNLPHARGWHPAAAESASSRQSLFPTAPDPSASASP